MKVLLLGATGLLGHNVLQRLTDSGHEAVALVRRRDGLRIMPAGTQVVEGQPTDGTVLTAAAEGCDAIINCTGVTDMSLLHAEDYAEVNTRLCHTLLEVMKHHGIKHLVHTSTVNTIGYGRDGQSADESAEMAAPFDKSLYAASKLRGETIIREEALRHPDWHAVVVNPGFMLGPMDAKPSSGRMLLAAYRRRLMLAPSGGKAFVDVRDVAAAVVNALTMGRNGARYIAVSSCGHLTVKELYQLQARAMGYRQRVLTLPDWVLLTAGAAGNALRAMGVRTELSLNNVRQLMVREHYSNRRAMEELLMPESDIAQAIVDFHRWRKENTTNKQ